MANSAFLWAKAAVEWTPSGITLEIPTTTDIDRRVAHELGPVVERILKHAFGADAELLELTGGTVATSGERTRAEWGVLRALISTDSDPEGSAVFLRENLDDAVEEVAAAVERSNEEEHAWMQVFFAKLEER